MVLTREATVEEAVEAVDRDGYVLIEGLMDPEWVAAARADMQRVLAETSTGRNSFEGFSTQRVYALFAKTRYFDGPGTHPLVLGVLDHVLGHYQFSAPVGIQIGPGEKAQVLHRDDDVYPLPRTGTDVVVNTMWPLDDFTVENGATRFVPGSHRWEAGRKATPEETTAAVMPAGSVLIYVGNLVHGGGANTTDRPRLGVILEYAASWLRPQENHVLAVPKEIARELPPRLQELLGYNIHPPFLGYVDGHHPRRVLQS